MAATRLTETDLRRELGEFRSVIQSSRMTSCSYFGFSAPLWPKMTQRRRPLCAAGHATRASMRVLSMSRADRLCRPGEVPPKAGNKNRAPGGRHGVCAACREPLRGRDHVREPREGHLAGSIRRLEEARNRIRKRGYMPITTT